VTTVVAAEQILDICRRRQNSLAVGRVRVYDVEVGVATAAEANDGSGDQQDVLEFDAIHMGG